MSKFLNLNAIAVAIGLASSAGAMAQTMSKGHYNSEKDNIAYDYKSNLGSCKPLAGNANDICQAEAKGKQKVAKADLEARYKPSANNRYKVRVAMADADYLVAREKCDDRAGNVKDVCVERAKAAAVAVKADAKAQMKTANANKKAAQTGVAARKDARSDKRDAAYAVAKEKCDVFAGAAKSNCVIEAKARYGKT